MRELGLKLLESRSLQVLVVVIAFIVSMLHLVLISQFAVLILYLVIVLVTLRKGRQAGAELLVLPMLGLAMFAVLGQEWLFLSMFAAYLGIFYVASVILHERESWHDVLIFLMVIGLGIIVVAYQVNPDLRDFWMTFLHKIVAPVVPSLPEKDLSVFLTMLSSYMTGAAVFMELLQVVLVLIVARVWQAAMYMPGKFREEFQNIRLKRWISTVIVIPLLLSLEQFSGVVPDSLALIANDVFVVMMLPLFIAGISLMHAYVHHRGWGSKGVWAGYILLFFLRLSFVTILCIWAILDSVFDFRTRYQWRLANANPRDRDIINK